MVILLRSLTLPARRGGHELQREPIEQFRMRRRIGGMIVFHRVDDAAAHHERPQAVDRGLGEARNLLQRIVEPRQTIQQHHADDREGGDDHDNPPEGDEGRPPLLQFGDHRWRLLALLELFDSEQLGLRCSLPQLLVLPC